MLPGRHSGWRKIVAYFMNPMFWVVKLARFGKTLGKSSAETPNQVASVAPYWSSDIVGIQLPRLPESSGPPSASVGKLP